MILTEILIRIDQTLLEIFCSVEIISWRLKRIGIDQKI